MIGQYHPFICHAGKIWSFYQPLTKRFYFAITQIICQYENYIRARLRNGIGVEKKKPDQKKTKMLFHSMAIIACYIHSNSNFAHDSRPIKSSVKFISSVFLFAEQFRPLSLENPFLK